MLVQAVSEFRVFLGSSFFRIRYPFCCTTLDILRNENFLSSDLTSTVGWIESGPHVMMYLRSGVCMCPDMVKYLHLLWLNFKSHSLD